MTGVHTMGFMRKVTRLPELSKRFGIYNLFRLAYAKYCFIRDRHVKLLIPGHKEFYLRTRSSDIDVFRQIFVNREYSQDKIPVNPRIIIDCGANIGLSAIHFSNIFPGAQIFALEPEPSNYEMLVKNTSKYQNIYCINKALWGRTTTVEIADSHAPKWGFSMKESCEGGEKIQASSIQDLMRDHGIEHIDILKIDIEGGEKDVFSSDCAWMRNVSLLIIELHDRVTPGSSNAFYNAIRKMNFHHCMYDESIYILFNEVK